MRHAQGYSLGGCGQAPTSLGCNLIRCDAGIARNDGSCWEVGTFPHQAAFLADRLSCLMNVELR